DGSSIKGFKEIHESDMVMNPDPSTFAVLPWYEGEHRTARFIVDVYEGGSHERFTRDSRYMAQKAAQFAADQGYDTNYWGPLIESFGMTLDAHHHEVATAGQCEIDMRYDELVPMADNVATYRYVMKMVAHKMGMMATFMPKPIFGDNASGMHVHQSLWTNGKNMM